jgi:hypothetical protein
MAFVILHHSIPALQKGYNRAKMGKKSGFSYDGTVGRWWLKHSLDGAHRRAYRNIADFIRDSFTREPATIVDYACGAGDLLSLLSLCFRNSKLVGLDGSSYMLERALRRFRSLQPGCVQRIRLIHTPLPNLNVLPGRADLAIYCFPNMVAFPDDIVQDSRYWLNEDERQMAKDLSLAAESCNDADGFSDPAANQYVLEQGRSISMNLRRLLVPGGICMRIEYATVQRQQLSPAELLHVSFEEGSLETGVKGKKARQWFRVLASAYFRSRVLEDVYEQTGDERDRNGGYLITVLRAI